MKKYCIIGNGVAGTTAAEQITKKDPNGSISIFSSEDLPFYYRIRLPEVIAGAVTEQGIVAKKPEWYAAQNIKLHTGTTVSEINPDSKVVMANSKTFPYDVLLLATGSTSFIPPITGADKNGVFTLRHIQDARDIIAAAQQNDTVIIIGGGLLGLEAGNGLRRLGKKIRVVEFFPRLLPRQLDVEGAQRLQKMFETMGFSFTLGAVTKEIMGNVKVTGIVLENGERISGDMVLISAGVRPHLELAKQIGLDIDKGIKVNDLLQTSNPDIYAAGDVIEYNGIVYGIWPAAMEQGKIAGMNMAGYNKKYQGTVLNNILKVAGIDVASAGEIDAENKFDSKVFETPDHYKKIVLDKGKIIGCIMLGDINGFHDLTRAIADKLDFTAIDEGILKTNKKEKP